MQFRSVLKPEGSIVAGLAVMGSVFAIYQLDVGGVASAYATDANHPALESSRKKAGYTALVLVGSLTLITRDANVGILGFGSIVAMELHYRHAIMAAPETGKIVPPAPSQYQPAIDNNADTGAGVYPFPVSAAE
jgi:hypothetical protein